MFSPIQSTKTLLEKIIKKPFREILTVFREENNKIDKDNFEKNHKKIMWKITAAIHSVLKKKKLQN